MRDESRLRALTGLSELWDGSPLKRTRVGDGAIQPLNRAVVKGEEQIDARMSHVVGLRLLISELGIH